MLHFPLCFSLPSNFWFSWVDGYADRSSSLRTAEYVLSELFLASEAANLNAPSNIAFPTPVPSSVHESSNIFLTEDPACWPCSPNPPKVLPLLRIPDRPPQPRTTSQNQNGLNYHFHLGLLYADDPPDPHYENPHKVFQPSQQTLTTEGHHPSHDIFYQILSRRLWKNLNQEVHLRHLPHLLSQSFHLSCPYMTRGYYQSLTTKMLCLDLGKCLKFTSPFWRSKLKTHRYACDGISSKPATNAFWLGTCIHRTKGYVVLTWSRKNRCRNIGLVFSGIDLKYWINNSRGTQWWTKW